MEVVNRLNGDYFLPSLQRPYVWGPRDIERLFDSLMRKFPISSFLIWKVRPESVEGLHVYKFIEDFAKDISTNKPANLGNREVSLVLDGQQRLTSLLIGVRGSFEVKVGRAFVRKYLYCDLLKTPADAVYGEDDGYDFKFMDPDKVVNNRAQQWIRVSEVAACRSEQELGALANRITDQARTNFRLVHDQINTMHSVLTLLHNVLWSNDNIAYYTETGNRHDRVLEIFVRANSAGEKLSKSALMLSSIITSWGTTNLRDEINDFLKDNQAKGRGARNAGWLDTDWLMKTCLVVSDLPVVYKLESFNQANISTIKSNWNAIKSAVTELVKLLNGFGIDGSNLTSKNALLPIVYFIAHTGLRASTSNETDEKNRQAIRVWLLKVLLARSFGAASDGKIIAGRKIISRSLASLSNMFPADALIQEINSHDKINLRDPACIEAILDTEYKDGRYCFLALSLIYPNIELHHDAFHIDHIFPVSQLTTNRLINAGIADGNLQTVESAKNKLANLCLLTAEENLQKSDREFGHWLQLQGESYRSRHVIPEDIRDFSTERFLEFYDGRHELLAQRLALVLGFAGDGGENSAPGSATPSASDRDSTVLTSERHYDLFLSWDDAVRTAFGAFERAVAEYWPAADVYRSARGLSEDLEIGRYPLNDGPRIDSKILGIKLTDTGFLVRFSADLTEILSDYLAESLQPLPYTIDDISGSLVVDIRAGRDRDLGQRLSSLISHLTQQNCADRFAEGKGQRPDDYD
jgi:hypothetical protein